MNFQPAKTIEFLQRFANDFIWHGQNKVNTEVTQNPLKTGGLNHINVKHFLHKLRTMCMMQLWEDRGQLWSVFAGLK